MTPIKTTSQAIEWLTLLAKNARTVENEDLAARCVETIALLFDTEERCKVSTDEKLDELLSTAQLTLRDGYHDHLSRAIADARNLLGGPKWSA